MTDADGCQPEVSYCDPRDVGELVEPLRSRIHTLILDAPRNGLVLLSGRRTPWMQWILRHERCPGRECNPVCQGIPTTALPGRSKHQRGEAADLTGIDLMWANANALRYGTSADVVPREPWHFEVMGQPSVRIIPFDTPDPPADPNAGHDWASIHPGDTDATIYARGGLTGEVSEVQWRLNMLAGRLRRPDMNVGVGDGIYGSRSQHAAMVFRVWIIYQQRAAGKPTWSLHITPEIGERYIAMLRFWTN